jgi:hypothetical protein
MVTNEFTWWDAAGSVFLDKSMQAQQQYEARRVGGCSPVLSVLDLLLRMSEETHRKARVSK